MQDNSNYNRENFFDSLAGTGLTSREAAAFLGMSVKTLDSWRRFGRGPAFIRQGSAIRYRLADLIEFQERHRVEPERA